MPSHPQLSCPACQRPIEREHIRGSLFECPQCGAMLQFSFRGLSLAVVLSFIVSLVVSQWIGLKTYAAILWIPLFLLCLIIVLPFIVSPVLKVCTGDPRKRRNAIRSNLLLFFTGWVGLTFFGLIYGYIYGLGAFLLGSKRDLSEVMEMWSAPLSLINPGFRITPNKSFISVLGILAANSYFYALVLSLIFKFVHARFQRSRVIQLGISDPPIGKDEDEF